MSLTAPDVGMSPDAWVSARTGLSESVEIVGGELVVKRLGGNPHHYVARRLAEEFERQWTGVAASSPGNWVLERTPDGRIVLGRVPDVLVNGSAPLVDEVFVGTPDAAVEVEWTVNIDGARWVSTAVAAADQPLHIDGPRPFRVTPNDLLRPLA